MKRKGVRKVELRAVRRNTFANSSVLWGTFILSLRSLAGKFSKPCISMAVRQASMMEACGVTTREGKKGKKRVKGESNDNEVDNQFVA